MKMEISRRVAEKNWQWPLATVVAALLIAETVGLSGSNVCMVKQKYNITKRIKYRAPMSVRTYEWCFSMPPRCSRWNTEMRDLTRLETEERTAEVAVCCPGYKMKDVSCVPICPNGKTGPGCSKDCQPNRWGPNCVNECKDCSNRGTCSPTTGECICQEGWQGESCQTVFSTTTSTPSEELLTSSKSSTKTNVPLTTEVNLLTSPVYNENATTILLKTTTISTSSIPIILTSTPPNSTLVNKHVHNDMTHNIKTESTIELPIKISTTPEYNPGTTTDKLLVNTKNNASSSPISDNTLATTMSVSENMAYLNKESIKNKGDITTRIFPTSQYTRPISTAVETTKKPETTARMYPTTTKFKPKEIWIKPAQKGEAPIVDQKKHHDSSSNNKHKNTTKTENITKTTPKTIIVSIIPTSVSYASFKKISLTTASYVPHKINVTKSKHSGDATKPTPIIKIPKSTAKYVTETFTTPILTTPLSLNHNTLKSTSPSPMSTKRNVTKAMFVNNTTNSMSSSTKTVSKPFNSLTSTTVSSINSKYSFKLNTVTENINMSSVNSSHLPIPKDPTVLVRANSKSLRIPRRNITVTPVNVQQITKEITSNNMTNETKKYVDIITNVLTTEQPAEDEEKFHVLTEPEHITAVMSDKESERSSLDLLSVISIAGGVMMAVITVAVVIVMMERRRPRYEDVRKISNIRMQVMIDNNDVPPPYVRSIFHTPLPDPPVIEKCHYQPISTLDRNLKQFMRPVIVQTISPIMLENFRGILECHYDHLPSRSHETDLQARCSVAPSISPSEQPLLERASLTESAIDALKCEAKLNIIDHTTSEPLYAEIPCWRPPSEHAIEIMSVNNGEAVTEL